MSCGLKFEYQGSAVPHITGLGVSNSCEFVNQGFLPIDSAIGGKSEERGGDMDMRSHLHARVNRKVSHFIMGEEGKVGNRSAFTAAVFIGTTSLAGVFLGAPNASAEGNGWCGINCADDELCCGCWDEIRNAPFEGCAQGTYECQPLDHVPTPGISCWAKP